MATAADRGGAYPMAKAGPHLEIARRIEGLLWLALLLLHLVGAVLWFVVQPGGFDLSHPRFWVNRIIPVLVLAWGCGSIRALHRTRGPFPALWAIPWPALWAGLAIAGRIAFPDTLGRAWIVPLAGALILTLRALTSLAAYRTSCRIGVMAVAGVAFLCGVFCATAQRPPHPSTVPIGGRLEFHETDDPPAAMPRGGSRSLPGGLMVQLGDASVTARIQGLTIIASPLLRFLSRSPDGCWTVFVPSNLREERVPRLISARPFDPDQGAFGSYRIPEQGPAQLRVSQRPGSQSSEIEALSRLDRPIHSHLNSFCDLEVRGHRRLSLEFSPCPGRKVEVRRFDYPVGRPARFAFVDRDRRFRVVEATSGEKGPFHVLAEGRLERPDPLRIILHDEDRALTAVTLHDWSAQAGTELSPTAGWGVPVNAIEFSLNRDAPSSPASIFITLAATSVGRGWDCVTHPAGTYRNRMTIEPATP